MARGENHEAALAETISAAFDDTFAAPATGDADPKKTAPIAIAKGTPDRYRIRGELGAGGMGRVLDATDLWFGRRVALKEMLVDGAPLSLTRRFLVEALVTGNLEHTGIVPVYERGVREGRPYYVMRKLDGKTLGDALAQAKDFRARSKFVPALVRVAQTLAYAHECGVIHRDIKPDNIILGTHGEVTVIDWGIARVRNFDRFSEEDGPRVASITDKTMVGSVIGTPAYMAPEQAAGKMDAIDERTDVFALGALLYHVLSGRAPFEGATAEAQMQKALAAEFPPIDARKAKVPARLVAICTRAMAKDPADRFSSAPEMAKALERSLTDALNESPTINAVTTVVTVLALASATLLATLVWRAVPAWRAMGTGVFPTTIAACIGLGLGILDFVTKGLYKIQHLVIAFIGLTFAGGMLATVLGVLTTIQAARDLTNASDYLHLIGDGTYESLGNFVVGTAGASLQLLVWAVARRRSERTKKEAENA